MSKILAVFAVTGIQSQQIPFTTAHVYVYLVHITNACATLSNPPFFVATFLEVVLRIAAARLYVCYGEVFMALCEVMQESLLVKLDDKMPKKKSLETFLKRFISSQGRDFMSLFTKQDE